MKTLILTNMLISQRERYLIERSSILKIAVNWAWYKADYRVIKDKFYENEILNQFPEQMVQHIIDPTISHNPRITLDHTLYFWYGSITSAISLAINKESNDILLIADNTVHGNKFTNGIKEGIKHLNKFTNIYKCTKNGNFDLPYKSIEEFIND